MATGSSFLSEDRFRCSVCLDVFADPVTVPCGQWSAGGRQQWPGGPELFDSRPALRVNAFLSDMAAYFRSSAGRSAARTPPKDVLCDACAKSKQKAVKSSHRRTRLEPHRRTAMETQVCTKHDKPLEMFCRTDRAPVCLSCAASDHRRHHVVPLIDDWDGKRKELDVQQMIQERLLKIEQLNQSLKVSKEAAEGVMAAAVEDCAALIKSSRRNLDLLMDVIERKQEAAEAQAAGFVKELEEEISELLRRSLELKSPSRSEDRLQLRRNVPARDWTKARVQPSCDGTVRTAAAELGTLRRHMEKLCADVEVSRVRLYQVDVTLDRDTANPHLVLSEDRKRVGCGEAEQSVPDTPQRLSSFAVLGEQAFSSGRFYYEVQVGGKTKWELGVVRESINRKAENTICPENGYWVVWLRNGHYRALSGPSVPLHLKSKPQKVGVFVDQDEGLVRFYDPDAPVLIYSFAGCKFGGKLLPYFSPCPSDGGKNSTPLIISPISRTL
ncbi:E3 ubiquitin-protein ligase TRIM21-like [Kryptolebias marmoratus]|uniref:E3 ubiquitin-protein ligase TRIM21-like n=1 Tax=Kryptolebias marmoratus TaxID=37003 RepID=A0A3Q3BEQ7_KRYMA|nr:E3 ubiquitin-protein ligase TRIM21-like [Kryptolebias marmoratus]